MGNKQGIKSVGIPGCSTAVFFSFICVALMSLAYFSAGGFTAMPAAKGLLLCIALLLLLSAAYTGSCYGNLYLPLTTALLGAVSAAALCLIAAGLKSREMENLFLLPVLVLAVPLQFLMSVSGMKTALMLRQALSQSASAAKENFRTQKIMMLLSLAASAGLMVCVIFR